LLPWLAFLLSELQQLPSTPEIDKSITLLKQATLSTLLMSVNEVETLWNALATQSLGAELSLQNIPLDTKEENDDEEQAANDMDVTVRFEHIYDDESDFGQQCENSNETLFSVDVQGDRLSVLNSLEEAEAAKEGRKSTHKKKKHSVVSVEEIENEKKNTERSRSTRKKAKVGKKQ